MEYQSCDVTLTIGEKEFSQSYEQVVRKSVTTDDLLALLQKDAQQVINDWHYGQDLRAKASVRNQISAKQAGPERSIEKSVKEFMKRRELMGKPVTEEKAREIIKLMDEMEN